MEADRPRTGVPSVKVALAVTLGGLALFAVALAARLHGVIGPALGLSLHWPRWTEVAGSVGLLVGGALLAGGGSGLVFAVATRRSFEWFIAWRYLRDRGGRSWATLIVGGILGLAAIGFLVASHLWGKAGLEDMVLGPSPTQRLFQILALGLGLLAYVVIFFGVLLLSFSLFTSISVFGVFLGTCALVVVLSVMGGFENDLRGKILGTNAHIVITRPGAVFTDYRKVEERLARTPELLAYSPYLESEVMVTSQTNLSGVLLKGIDPTKIGKVTDLKKYLSQPPGTGRLDDLLHPERLARIPEARFRPMVTEPLGKPLFEEGDVEDEPAAKKKPKKGIKEKLGDEQGALRAPGPSSKPAASQPASRPSGDDDLDARAAQIRVLEGERKRLEAMIRDAENQIGKKVPPRPVYPGILIGAELAKNLRLYVGDDVNLVAPLGGMSPAGPIPKSRPFRVAGIFYSGMYEYDTKFVYVRMQDAQRFLGFEDEVTGIEIKMKQVEAAPRVAEELQAGLGSRFRVQDWRQLNVSLFSALKLEKFVMFAVLTFIIIVAAFSIVTDLIMVVLAKTREIAALKTMGVGPWSALKIFFYAGFYIGIIGMLVGVLTGVGLCLFLSYVGLPLDPEVYYISELPVRMSPFDISMVGLASVLLSFLATIYPSLLAARLKPVEGLRRYEV